MAAVVDDGPGLLGDVAFEDAEVVILGEHVALVDDAEVRTQVSGEVVGPEGTGRRLAPALVGGRCQLFEEGSASWIERRQDLLGGLRDRHERTPSGLRERPQELDDELLS